MQVVNDAMNNISLEQISEFKLEDQKRRFIEALSSEREVSREGFFKTSDTGPSWLSATPKLHKPTKAEKKQSKRERRAAYPY